MRKNRLNILAGGVVILCVCVTLAGVVAYLLLGRGQDEASPDNIEKFSKSVDNKLQQYNIEYEAKRGSNRIGHIEVCPLQQDAFEKFKSVCLSKGQRD